MPGESREVFPEEVTLDGVLKDPQEVACLTREVSQQKDFQADAKAETRCLPSICPLNVLSSLLRLLSLCRVWRRGC